jgi:uncharacterized membrane protein YgcG
MRVPNRNLRSLVRRAIRTARPFELLCVCLLAMSVLGAQEKRLPASHGRVNDFAEVIDAEWAPRLQRLIREVDQRASAELAVVTIESLEGVTIEEYARRLFNEWGIGEKDRNNGVLLLAAIRDRKVRIEVGYGLEPTITNRFAAAVIQEEIVPRFRRQEYGAGTYAALQRLAHRIAAAEGVTLPLPPNPLPVVTEAGPTGTDRSPKSNRPGGWFGLLLLCSFDTVFVLLGLLVSRRVDFVLLRPRARCPMCRQRMERVDRPTRTRARFRDYQCRACGHRRTEYVRPWFSPTRARRKACHRDGWSSRDHDWSSGGGGWSSDSGGFGGGASGGSGASGSW